MAVKNIFKAPAEHEDPYERIKEAIHRWYRYALDTGDWKTYEYWRGYLQGARDQREYNEKEQTT